jgi:putative FmdB family regulatory protein
MPTYEYACTSCGQHVEVFQRISEEPLQTCGVCGGHLRKVFHPAGIVFKGSGFYATDSRPKPASDSGTKDAKKDVASQKDGVSSKDAASSKEGGDAPASGAKPRSSGEGGSNASKDGPTGPTRATSGEKAS